MQSAEERKRRKALRMHMHYERNKERLKAEARTRGKRTYIQRTYNVSPERLAHMLAQQDRKCAACKRIAPLAVDHDHSCCPGEKSCGFCVRGLLCKLCNGALGFLKDDPLRMYALADYVGKFEA